MLRGLAWLTVHVGLVRFKCGKLRGPGCPHFKAGRMLREAVGSDIPKVSQPLGAAVDQEPRVLRVFRGGVGMLEVEEAELTVNLKPVGSSCLKEEQKYCPRSVSCRDEVGEPPSLGTEAGADRRFGSSHELSVLYQLCEVGVVNTIS